MMLRWTARALQDRLEIWYFIASENAVAAVAMEKCFDKAAVRLADFSEVGVVGKIPGTREIIPHKNYRLIYEVDEDEIRILALVHVAREWPPSR